MIGSRFPDSGWGQKSSRSGGGGRPRVSEPIFRNSFLWEAKRAIFVNIRVFVGGSDFSGTGPPEERRICLFRSLLAFYPALLVRNAKEKT